MNLLLVKLYEEYMRKGDPNPEMKLTAYLTLVYIFLFFCIFLPTSELVSDLYFGGNLKINSSVLLLILLSTAFIVYKLTYKRLFKKGKIRQLRKKYSATKLPRVLLYLIVIMLPISLILLGATLTVFISGGEMFGYSYKGWIN
jgi:hypothetical protein